MRKKNFVWNTFSSLGAKVVSILCAFILPRLILKTYGTDTNGLISSISQFLTVIALSEFGITAVVQSALYKPLAMNDVDEISRIMVSSSKFFRKIALLLIVYTFMLCLLYPIFINNSFGFWYTSILILAMSINSLMQYLFGITNSQLIFANQHGYIINITGIIVNILNTIMCCILIYLGASIQFVKITTALIYIIQPLTYAIYVKKHYSINYKIKYDTEPITQKWNGVAQHIAYYVLNSTDIMVLTFFSTLENVSIYYVYHLVLSGINQLFSIFENAVKPLLGEFWARGESKQLKKYFSIYEWMIHYLTCIIFGCTLILIVPFVRVYTLGVNDANYIVPTFAIIITLAYAVQSIRNPYNTIIMSAGHYKQTQSNYIITAILNIVISIISVLHFGLVGVAIGTLIALLFQTCWQSWYIYANILKEKFWYFIKHMLIDILTLTIIFAISINISLNSVNYISWLFMALKVFIINIILITIINIIVYRSKMIESIKLVMKNKVS